MLLEQRTSRVELPVLSRLPLGRASCDRLGTKTFTEEQEHKRTRWQSSKVIDPTSATIGKRTWLAVFRDLANMVLSILQLRCTCFDRASTSAKLIRRNTSINRKESVEPAFKHCIVSHHACFPFPSTETIHNDRDPYTQNLRRLRRVNGRSKEVVTEKEGVEMVTEKRGR